MRTIHSNFNSISRQAFTHLHHIVLYVIIDINEILLRFTTHPISKIIILTEQQYNAINKKINFDSVIQKLLNDICFKIGISDALYS